METEKTSVKCPFCSKLNASYTCPRCNLPYCSKSCYQSAQHSDCSEQFYKECVEEELKLENVGDSSRKQMMEILTRFQSEAGEESPENDSDDDDSLPDLYDRLQNVDLNDADEVWKRLSEQEKLEFQAILNSGDVSQLIPEYEPWWCKRYEKKVQELDDFLNETNKKQYSKICPSSMEIAPFQSISKVNPSPYILWNITNVLASYAYTVRRYLGEHQDYCYEAIDTVISISDNLNKNENFDTKQSAVDSVIFCVTSNPLFACPKQEAVFLQEDVDRLLNGPEDSEPAYYILAALSDLHQLCNRTISSEKKNKKDGSGEFSKKYPTPLPKTFDKGKLRLIAKKLEFYASWTKDHYK